MKIRDFLIYVFGIVTGVIGLTLYQMFGRPVMPSEDEPKDENIRARHASPLPPPPPPDPDGLCIGGPISLKELVVGICELTVKNMQSLEDTQPVKLSQEVPEWIDESEMAAETRPTEVDNVQELIYRGDGLAPIKTGYDYE